MTSASARQFRAAVWSPRAAKAALLVLILSYGAGLRFAAIIERFGPVTEPAWLAATQQWTAAHLWRPAGMVWEPAELYPHRDGPPTRHRSDPYTYLQYAREMRSFYAAHHREPLFPFATKVSLWLLDDQDVAVSFASAAFSVLAIAATFALGALLFGYWAGAAAGALMAIEYDVVSWGVQGWRDDAFALAVVMTTVALVRVRREPGWRTALVLGVMAGGACLVRITALSFVLPGIAAVVLAGHANWRRTAAAVGLALAVVAIVIGPFLLNSWRAFGDPLHAINVHATVYQETEGGPEDGSLTAREYLERQFRERPVRTADTVVQGLTAYPFTNKWTGFAVWHPALGWWLSVSAVAGLILLAGSPDGRVFLVVLVSSLVPYAATWKVIADWRFTEHAYPFFLIAACVPPALLVLGIRIAARRESASVRRERAALVWVAASVVFGGLLWYASALVLPVWVFRESLNAGDTAVVTALERDAAFFGREWTPVPSKGVPTRVTTRGRGAIDLPLPGAADYELLLRVDPSTAPVAPDHVTERIHLLLNGRIIARCEPGSTPDRIGICRARLRADAVRAGTNRLVLASDNPQPPGFRVWYVSVRRAGEP